MTIHRVIILYLMGVLFAVIVGANFNIYKFIFVYMVIFTGTLSAIYNNNYNDINIGRNSKQTFFLAEVVF